MRRAFREGRSTLPHERRNLTDSRMTPDFIRPPGASGPAAPGTRRRCATTWSTSTTRTAATRAAASDSTSGRSLQARASPRIRCSPVGTRYARDCRRRGGTCASVLAPASDRIACDCAERGTRPSEPIGMRYGQTETLCAPAFCNPRRRSAEDSRCGWMRNGVTTSRYCGRGGPSARKPDAAAKRHTN